MRPYFSSTACDVGKAIILRSDDGLVFTSRSFAKTVKDYKFKQECIWHYNFTSLKETNNIIGNWIRFYNEERRHLALKYRTPAEAYRLAA
ncbi:integrase core domain-containing protein [Hydrogenimonas cancrithermarum]|uniref:Integrase catalytic domain-containing protein n=1 Tax=Hydrogenimonas cancrithermarum TaxID=2993563 RepID=A0ABN6WUI8_9BACT|nr:integrase core domain-containing protein [Hydrogenimonas cancrithermarum]BDY12618.1 hypothetical protein HCR_09300 [Hydrogenimonas cancrithermarum]